MADGRRRAIQAFGKLDLRKKNKVIHIPGVLGVPIGGVKTVEIPNREGYVYVRLRNSTSELVQVYNDQVAPVYGLPVLIKKDDIDPNRYVVAGRDLGMYQNWGNSPYLPKHGNTHRFWEGGGGDVVFVEGRQMMPLLVHPSGTSGACNVVVEPDVYYQDGNWKYGGGTGTGDLCSLKPTDNTAKMVLVYLDGNANPQLLGGSTFSASLTGTAQVLPYVPSPPAPNSIPLAWVRLVSGTERVSWSNIYDARPWIVGDGVLSTGTSTARHIIQDEGSAETDRPALNFVGSTIFVEDDAGNNRTNVIVSGSSGGGHVIQNEGSAVTQRTALNFVGSTVYVTDDGGNDRTNVIISGSASGGGWSSGAKAARFTPQSIPDSDIYPVNFTSQIYDTDNYFTIVTGSATRMTIPEDGVYTMVGSLGFDSNATGTRGITLLWNGNLFIAWTFLTIAGGLILNVSGIERLETGDYVELAAWQDSGGPLNDTGADTHLAIQRIG